jgi:nucleoside-diphosphate-sugar epimerase
VDEGVSRFVYLSSLDVMERYAPDLVVTERWRPVPSTDVSTLSHHLGEYVCREFGREGIISVVCLRLGRIVKEDDDPGPTTLHIGDAIHAVERALTAELDSSQTTWSRPGPPTRWGMFHIQSPVPNARFTTATAERVLGYSPTFEGQV